MGPLSEMWEARQAPTRWVLLTLKVLLLLAAVGFVWVWVVGVPLLYADVPGSARKTIPNAIAATPTGDALLHASTNHNPALRT